MGLVYTVSSPLFAQDDAIILTDIILTDQLELEHPPMTPKSPLGGLAIAVFAVLSLFAAPQSARAQGLVDFLWGGDSDFGGGRHVVSFSPQYKPGQLIVSFSDRRLYFVTKQGQALTYPVAVPTGEARWQGTTFVSDKKINPPWTPTPEMISKNPRLPRWVPGGHPMNPLGVRAMYLGSSAYRIHGTDAPWTIGQAVSHGCIRMTNEDVLDLYPRIPVGTRVTVTWQKFSSSAIASNDTGSASVTDENGDPKRKYYRSATKRVAIPARRQGVQKAAEAQ
jgi:lipoprotein-anchoring transpeptidase ErfK/SrfK